LHGKLQFENALLNLVGPKQEQRCVVSSACEIVAPGAYEVTLSRDSDKCCIEVHAVHGLPVSEGVSTFCSLPTCSTRAKFVSPALFQFRPMSRVWKHMTPRSQVRFFKQKEGAVTSSFMVVNVDIQSLSSSCESALVQAIQESMAYRAGIGFGVSSVSVAIKGSKFISTEKSRQPSFFEDVSFDGIKSSNRSVELAEEFSNVVIRPPWQRMGDDAERRLSEGANRLVSWRRRRHHNRKRVHVQILQAVVVQITVTGCGDCLAVLQALKAKHTVHKLLKRIIADVGSETDCDAGQGQQLSIAHFSVPATPTSCARFRCLSYQVNRFPRRLCYGSTCITTCCEPITCAQTRCSKPLVNNPSSDLVKCTDEEDCGNKCCLLPCQAYKCSAKSTCSRPNSWMRIVKPHEAEKKCCKKAFPPCCHAPIAWCVSCSRCQSLEAYCESRVSKWLLQGGHHHHHRRLGVLGNNSLLELPQGFSYDQAAELRQQPRQATVDEWMRKVVVQHDLSHHLLSQSIWKANHTQYGLQDTLRYAKDSNQVDMLKGMLKMEKRAVELYRRETNDATISDLDLGLSASEAWKEQWNKAVLAARANHQFASGCELGGALPCPYRLQTVFLLHRGFKPKPLSANCVQVLTDTSNAVSCGDDGLCWIWRIKDAKPRQVFPGHRGPVLTVSVLNDATYILSAGSVNADGTEGEALLWDRHQAILKERLVCPDGVWLSSSEMPAWRLALLGCADGFTTIWDWDRDRTVKLPFLSRSQAEAKGALRGRFKRFRDKGLTGVARLPVLRYQRPRDALKALGERKFQEQTEAIKAAKNTLKVRFGSVRAIDYAQTRLRFVTGHGDGLVRYWNADSGKLIRPLAGHLGPVNTVVASSTKQEAASGGDDGTARYWDLETGAQLFLLNQRFGGPVRALAIFPGSKTLAVGSDDGFVRLWDLKDGTLQCQIFTGGAGIRSIAVNPSNPYGQLLVASMDGYVRVFNPDHR